MRLIDADALKAVFFRNSITTKITFADGLSIMRTLEEAPAIDAVPVVRCGECKFWRKIESSLIGEVMCCIAQGSMNVQKAADDFCSYGERRDDD